MNERDRLRLRHIVEIEFREAHAAVPWLKASGIRNRLVHGYFDVDLGVVWQTAKDSIPTFADQVRKILSAGG